MTKTLKTAKDYRDEARSLFLSADNDPDTERSDRYRLAGERCARVANLIDRGFSREEAAAKVTDRVDMDRVLDALRGRIARSELTAGERVRFNEMAAEVRRENALEARYS